MGPRYLTVPIVGQEEIVLFLVFYLTVKNITKGGNGMVFVLNKQKRPMDNCTPAKARKLLRDGLAVVHKQYPFTIRLRENQVHTSNKGYQIKIDPGAKTTGLAIVDSEANVVFLGELEHRGERIVSLLETRRQARRNRRSRETRYRKAKWGSNYKKKNSKFMAQSPRPEGWLPPSVRSVEQNIVNFVKKLMKLADIQAVAVESVKFDMQKMENARITGVEYQQGTLMGYEIRNYLLETKGHTCQYCGGLSGDKQLEVEHMHPKSRGGSNRLANLNLACHTCNDDKNNLTLPEYVARLKGSSSNLDRTRVRHIEQILKTGKSFVGLRYAAWANSMRHRLVADLDKVVLHVTQGTGGQTHFNRINGMGLPKEHYYDALCVGSIPAHGYNLATEDVLSIKAYGRGSHFVGQTNAYGFITKWRSRQKQVFGFQTGDIVKAVVTKGKKQGVYVGRIQIKKTGYFNIQQENGRIEGVSHKYCRLIQRDDGYGYQLKKAN